MFRGDGCRFGKASVTAFILILDAMDVVVAFNATGEESGDGVEACRLDRLF